MSYRREIYTHVNSVAQKLTTHYPSPHSIYTMEARKDSCDYSLWHTHTHTHTHTHRHTHAYTHTRSHSHKNFPCYTVWPWICLLGRHFGNLTKRVGSSRDTVYRACCRRDTKMVGKQSLQDVHTAGRKMICHAQFKWRPVFDHGSWGGGGAWKVQGGKGNRQLSNRLSVFIHPSSPPQDFPLLGAKVSGAALWKTFPPTQAH